MSNLSWIEIESGEGRLALLAVLCVLAAVAGWLRVVRHAAHYNVTKKVAATIVVGAVGGVAGYLAWAFIALFFVGK